MSGQTRFKVVIAQKDALFLFDKKVLKKTMRQAGQEVAAVAKRLIRSSTGQPGGPPKSVTGQLIRSIKVRPSRSGLSVRVLDDATDPKGRPYAVFLEAGTQQRTKPAGRVKRVHRKRTGPLTPKPGFTTVMPRPFLSLALDQRSQSLAKRIGDAVQAGVAFKRIKP